MAETPDDQNLPLDGGNVKYKIALKKDGDIEKAVNTPAKPRKPLVTVTVT